MKSNIPTNTSPIHDLKSSAMVKKLKFSCINDTSSSKLRREVMKHTLDGKNSFTKPHPFSTMSTIPISSTTGYIPVFQFQHGTNHEAHGESHCRT